MFYTNFSTTTTGFLIFLQLPGCFSHCLVSHQVSCPTWFGYIMSVLIVLLLLHHHQNQHVHFPAKIAASFTLSGVPDYPWSRASSLPPGAGPGLHAVSLPTSRFPLCCTRMIHQRLLGAELKFLRYTKKGTPFARPAINS